jgi:hypothetical protein
MTFLAADYAELAETEKAEPQRARVYTEESRAKLAAT